MSRAVYHLTRITVIAPAVRNDGEVSHYAERLAYALTARGYNFTEHPTEGVWLGKREPGTLFELYVDTFGRRTHAREIGLMARDLMPDQDAIQVTIDPAATLLLEY